MDGNGTLSMGICSTAVITGLLAQALKLTKIRVVRFFLGTTYQNREKYTK
jgi:hypothetical protein